MLPKEMLNGCIDQVVTVCVEGELTGFQGTVLEVEENWIKVKEKNGIRFVNGDMITQIIIRENKKRK